MQQSKRSKLRHARSRTWSVTNNTTHPSCQANHLRIFENNPSYTHPTHTRTASLLLSWLLFGALSLSVSLPALLDTLCLCPSLWLSGSLPPPPLRDTIIHTADLPTMRTAWLHTPKASSSGKRDTIHRISQPGQKGHSRFLAQTLPKQVGTGTRYCTSTPIATYSGVYSFGFQSP